MVAAGMGCTLLPAMALAGDEDRGFEIRPLDARACRRIGLVWRQSYPRAIDVEYLARTVRDHLPPSVRAT